MHSTEVPPEAFLAIWTFENGKTMTTLSSRTTYIRWLSDPIGYADKRIKRWNNKTQHRTPGPQWAQKAVKFEMVQYVKCPSNGAAPIVVAM